MERLWQGEMNRPDNYGKKKKKKGSSFKNVRKIIEIEGKTQYQNVDPKIIIESANSLGLNMKGNKWEKIEEVGPEELPENTVS